MQDKIQDKIRYNTDQDKTKQNYNWNNSRQARKDKNRIGYRTRQDRTKQSLLKTIKAKQTKIII